MKTNLFGPVSFYKKALLIALPVMAQLLIQNLVSLIDNFMVAGLGDVAMAAVNVTNQMNFVFVVITNAVCGAGGIYVAQYFGAKDASGMQEAYRFKMVFFIFISAIYFTLCWIIPKQMIGVMTIGNIAQAAILETGVPYMRLCSFTLLPMAFCFGIASSFREMGKPKIPLLISIVATLVNTAGNWILIYGNLGAPRMEVRGAAIATIIARLFELSGYLAYLFWVARPKIAANQTFEQKKAPFFVPFSRLFKVNWSFFFDILRKSGMIFLSEASWITSEMLMSALFNGRGGAETVAGIAAGNSIANLFFLAFAGVWTASQVIIGGSLGAGELDDAKKRSVWIFSGSVILGLVFGIIGALTQGGLIALVFTNLTSGAKAIGSGMVGVIMCYLPVWCLLNAVFATTRAGGDTAAGMVTDVTVNTGYFVPMAFILAIFTKLSPVEMFAILKAADAVKLFIIMYYYKKSRWIRNLAVIHQSTVPVPA